MARALCITHTASEHAGHLGTWLAEEGLDLHVVQPWNGDDLPSLDGYAALVVMGGPQQAYDDTQRPVAARDQGPAASRRS